MKRFGWLWSAIAGAVLLPMLSIGGALLYLSSLWGMRNGFFLSVFQWNVSDLEAAVPPACVGAMLGGLSGALWVGRSFASRALCASVGAVATAIGFGLLWRRLETPAPPPVGQGWFFLDLKQEFLLLCVKIAPALLWAWTLVFAAPFVGSSPKNPKQELALKMEAGAVAGAVLLPLVTGMGANIYLLQTGHSRAWIGTLVTLFWIQMPLTGAMYGALCTALWKGRRGYVFRGACGACSLLVAALTGQWLQTQFSISPWIRPTRTSLLIFAAPTMMWALALLFFALVTRSRRI